MAGQGEFKRDGRGSSGRGLDWVRWRGSGEAVCSDCHVDHGKGGSRVGKMF